jgi:predicted phage terminase large subunit-like protein
MGKGGDILIIDDPIKNYQESRSEAILESIWNWYGSVLNNRLEGGGAIIIIMHRWCENDLAGRILDLANSTPEADQYEVVRFPAICDERNPLDPRQIGEALWTKQADVKRLKAIRANDPRSFEALFQQHPSAEEGDLLKRKDMRNFYLRLPSGRCDKMIQSWDCAFKGDESHDYVVGQVWGVWGKNFYLIHEVRAHMTFTETIRAILLLSANYPEARIKLIEDKANGPAIIESAKKQVHGLVPFPEKGKPLGSKESRVKSISHIWEGQNVYLPNPLIASWIEDFISELASFPNGKRDDRVDSMSQAFIHLDQSNIDWINRFIGN